jgi:hypothetical protein
MTRKRLVKAKRTRIRKKTKKGAGLRKLWRTIRYRSQCNTIKKQLDEGNRTNLHIYESKCGRIYGHTKKNVAPYAQPETFTPNLVVRPTVETSLNPLINTEKPPETTQREAALQSNSQVGAPNPRVDPQEEVPNQSTQGPKQAADASQPVPNSEAAQSIDPYASLNKAQRQELIAFQDLIQQEIHSENDEMNMDESVIENPRNTRIKQFIDAQLLPILQASHSDFTDRIIRLTNPFFGSTFEDRKQNLDAMIEAARDFTVINQPIIPPEMFKLRELSLLFLQTYMYQYETTSDDIMYNELNKRIKLRPPCVYLLADKTKNQNLHNTLMSKLSHLRVRYIVAPPGFRELCENCVLFVSYDGPTQNIVQITPGGNYVEKILEQIFKYYCGKSKLWNQDLCPKSYEMLKAKSIETQRNPVSKQFLFLYTAVPIEIEEVIKHSHINWISNIRVQLNKSNEQKLELEYDDLITYDARLKESNPWLVVKQFLGKQDGPTIIKCVEFDKSTFKLGKDILLTCPRKSSRLQNTVQLDELNWNSMRGIMTPQEIQMKADFDKHHSEDASEEESEEEAEEPDVEQPATGAQNTAPPESSRKIPNPPPRPVEGEPLSIVTTEKIAGFLTLKIQKPDSTVLLLNERDTFQFTRDSENKIYTLKTITVNSIIINSGIDYEIKFPGDKTESYQYQIDWNSIDIIAKYQPPNARIKLNLSFFNTSNNTVKIIQSNGSVVIIAVKDYIKLNMDSIPYIVQITKIEKDKMTATVISPPGVGGTWLMIPQLNSDGVIITNNDVDWNSIEKINASEAVAPPPQPPP